jgi:hypothetical protein
MQDTVDQAHGAVPRALADIIQDASRAGCGHCCADSPAWCVLILRHRFLRHRSGWAAPGEMRSSLAVAALPTATSAVKRRMPSE